jgi:hypothetical protein
METEKITRIRRCKSQTVYNLAVLKDESYIANGVIVHNCRSALLPVTSKSRNEDLLIENRDFTQQYGQHFDALPDRIDSEIISDVFKDIDTFNDKYRIDKFILDHDVQLRLLKLDLSVIPGTKQLIKNEEEKL